MQETSSQFMAFLGVVSVLSILISAIMLFHMVQQAFAKEGVLWGLISMVYPPGTYLYCRKNWDVLGRHYIVISVLAIVGLTLWLAVKYL